MSYLSSLSRADSRPPLMLRVLITLTVLAGINGLVWAVLLAFHLAGWML